MKDAAIRVQEITDYLTSYRQKIKALNAVGLMDSAVLFELFAAKICELWFEKPFSNLNKGKANFEYVDLISEDESTFVQVTTVKNIPLKIKTTLEKIKSSTLKSDQQVKAIYFIVLENESLDKVKDFSGSNRIGNINFIAKEHVISTKNIIEKSKQDLKFQKELYYFLFDKEDSFKQLSKKLKEKKELSAVLLSNNINEKINNEYEVDRSKLINQIVLDNKKFVSIQGLPGSGKSALCKGLLKKEVLFLYTRAVQFAEVSQLEDIWAIDIKQCLHYLNGKRIVFFIDALEFIADCRHTAFDLLIEFYETVLKYTNAYILTSCRTSEKNAFLKLESNYSICVYEVNELDNKQLDLVGQEYPVIAQLRTKNEYLPLLRSPFYLDMIISKVRDMTLIENVNSLRLFIWESVICLKKKAKSYHLAPNAISSTIEKIAVTRAKEFTVGVDPEILDASVLDALFKEGVITGEDKKVRLKYDIFEDICFEQWIDKRFDNCRANYDTFFSSIEEIGRCIYRRYQIWVENKLFEKSNRQKFLYAIISSKIQQEFWKEQTLIGIVGSEYCKEFFQEYKSEIVPNRISEFLIISNRYAFYPNILSLPSGNKYTVLVPKGEGRCHLLQFIYEYTCYKDPHFKQAVIKLCIDYSKTRKLQKQTAETVCAILDYYIREEISELKEKWSEARMNVLQYYLKGIYSMAEFTKDWIRDFWQNLLHEPEEWHSNRRYLQDIEKQVLKEAPYALIEEMANDVCVLANDYWIKSLNNDDLSLYDFPVVRGNHYYGLTRQADHYDLDFRSILDNQFINILVSTHFWIALEWAVQVFNHVTNSILRQHLETLETIVIRIDENTICSYYGNYSYWIVDTLDSNMPKLLGDIVFVLKQYIAKVISNSDISDDAICIYADNIKKNIFQKSNNIMLFPLIIDIGMKCWKRIPGYAIELASSVTLQIYDLRKMESTKPNEMRDFTKKYILDTVSVPLIENRYEKNIKRNISLQEYISYCQLYGSDGVKKSGRIIGLSVFAD